MPAVFSLFVLSEAQAQITLSGTVRDMNSNEAIIGVNVAIKGKVTGTVTDTKGNFSLSTNTPPPFILVISSVGYLQQELEITESRSNLSIALEEQTIMGQEVVISASRVEENIMESPVAIEKMDILAVRNAPAATFYESLQNLKGVELATQSATFQSVNSRGFAATGNVRILQLIDGMDSQSITNNFSYGNIVGISELDVQSVELLPGPSSVLYGPNAINGTLLINSKNPFEYQGLSVNGQIGVMHVNSPDTDPEPMYIANLRYAKAFNNKFAFKTNIGFVRALDWHATSTLNTVDAARTLYDNTTRENNPGYNGVNNYGDEGFNVLGLQDPSLQAGLVATLVAQGVPQPNAEALVGSLPNQSVSRTGYLEPDLANYNAFSFKFHNAFHYRINENIEAIAQVNYNRGRTVYTGSGRFNVSNFQTTQAKLELRGSEFYVRVYGNYEDAGDSYDIQTLGQRIENAWKDNGTWFGEYAFAYLGLIPGIPGGDHSFARAFADNRDANGNLLIPGAPARPLPGEANFERIKEEQINTPLNRFGTRFTARNYFIQSEGMYNFEKLIDPKVLEIIVGAHWRRYVPNTEGTIFDDLPNQPSEEDLENFPDLGLLSVREITVDEYGGYVQLTKRFFNDYLKLVGSARIDKNQNFQARFTPRIAAVISAGANKQHNFRLSYQTGFRNPTMLNQYQNLTVGGVVTLIGGLPEFRNRFFGQNIAVGVGSPGYATPEEAVSAGLVALGIPIPAPTALAFDEFKPEFVETIEIGYKGLIANKLFIDIYGYYNWYSNFIGSQIAFQVDPNSPLQIPASIPGIGVFPIGLRQYEVPVNIEEGLVSYGWGIGLEYNLPKGYKIGGNISSDILDTPNSELPPNFLAGFNAPRLRTNLKFSNRDVGKGIGFNIAWRWQDAVDWESPGFFTGRIPGFGVIDAVVTYQVKKIKSIFKLGASNLLNNRYQQAFANPNLGAMYYMGITFDQFLN
ncbi:MAG: TonB-dependent receptor plug domain-containing protein [Microscillaceae bacterium]|nr:TonB-dependent receptor plug domain-containing protein [Microscillaceae bacterium]